MSRFFNFILLSVVSFCIYETFSVKRDVNNLAKEIRVLEANIRHEKELYSLYQVELSSLTNPENIKNLVAALLPEMKIISPKQIYSGDEINQMVQIAQSDKLNHTIVQSSYQPQEFVPSFNEAQNIQEIEELFEVSAAVE